MRARSRRSGDEAERFRGAFCQPGEDRLDPVPASAVEGCSSRASPPRASRTAARTTCAAVSNRELLHRGDRDDMEVLGHAARSERGRRQDPEPARSSSKSSARTGARSSSQANACGLTTARARPITRRWLGDRFAPWISNWPAARAAIEVPLTITVWASFAKSRGGSVAPLGRVGELAPGHDDRPGVDVLQIGDQLHRAVGPRAPRSPARCNRARSDLHRAGRTGCRGSRAAGPPSCRSGSRRTGSTSSPISSAARLGSNRASCAR